SFPLTITAVQSALFNCISEGAKPQKIYLSDALKDHAEYWLKEYRLETFDVEALRDKELYLPPKSLEMPILQMLKKLHERSQIEHSNFPVSALIETESGYYAGVNIENRDWDRGLCAERVALSKALSYGVTSFRALHLHARDGDFSSPCGSCRQVLLEHMPRKPVNLYHRDGSKSEFFTSDLLPYSFRSSSLQKNN
ncbi:MAG: cytidine deaminase, partial [Balneolaceae bacterium]|nr:cytidine deaminase [Balneolaceae bacterium]